MTSYKSLIISNKLKGLNIDLTAFKFFSLLLFIPPLYTIDLTLYYPFSLVNIIYSYSVSKINIK